MIAVYEYARMRGYTTVIMVGASLGAGEALRLAEYNRVTDDGYQPTLKMIVDDPALGGLYLPQPKWLVDITKHVHVGPLFNLLSPLVTRLLFKKLRPDQTNGVDPSHWDRHMAAMWRDKLSLIIEEIAAIAAQPPVFKNARGVPTAYLKCAHDDVIKGDETYKAWTGLYGASYLIDVPGGHVQFVENHTAWYFAHAQALRLLGYDVS